MHKREGVLREKIRIKAIQVFLLLILISTLFFLAWEYLSSSHLPIEQLRIRGISIVDGKQTPIILRGVNYLEVSNEWERPLKFADLERIKSLGFNSIRLPIYWEKLETEQGVVNYTFIEEYIDPLVEWCQNNSMYLVLDMHQWHTSSHFIYDPINGSHGVGFPTWLCESYDSEDKFLYDWWKNSVKDVSDSWTKFADIWCILAKRYWNYSYLAGYDIFNEPNRPSGIDEEELNSEILRRFYDYVIGRILKVDPNHLLFFEGEDGDSKPSLGKPKISASLVYSQHAYTEDHTLEACRKLIERATNKIRNWKIPLWIGEFGSSKNESAFACNMTSALNEKIEAEECSGWCWWCYKVGDSIDEFVLQLLWPHKNLEISAPPHCFHDLENGI